MDYPMTYCVVMFSLLGGVLLKKMIRKYYLSFFYVITFIFSFLLLMLHFVFQSVGKYSVSFTQLSPALAVVFLSIILKDRKTIKNIKSHFLLDKNFVKWVLPSIAIPGLCVIVSSFICNREHCIWCSVFINIKCGEKFIFL